MRAKILPVFVFGGLKAGKAKSRRKQNNSKNKESLLNTKKYARQAAQRPPRASFKPPQRLLRGGLPQQDAEAKTTTA